MADVNLDRFIDYVNKYLGKKVHLIFYVNELGDVFFEPLPNTEEICEEFFISKLVFTADNKISFCSENDYHSFEDWGQGLHLI